MPYLICDKCGSYYKLQPGESPEDFTDECECGGKLFYEHDSSQSDNMILDQTTRQSSWKQLLFHLDPKLELKLWGMIIIAFGFVELFFGLEIIFAIKGHFLMVVLSISMAIFFIPVGILPFIKCNIKIYWLFAIAFGLVLIQYILLTTNSNIINPIQSILAIAIFLIGIGTSIQKGTDR
jgi:hypothetical protein